MDGPFAITSAMPIGASSWSSFFFAATVLAYLTDLLASKTGGQCPIF